MKESAHNDLQAIVDKYVRYWNQEQVFGNVSTHCIHPDDIDELLPNSTLDLNACIPKSHIDHYDKRTDCKKIHVDLIPSPYMGDISNAKVLIFMNNPGIGKQDKFNKSGKLNTSFLGEYTDHERDDVRNALVSTIKQDMRNNFLQDYRFAFLHPELHDTEGGKYILRKFRSSIEHYCDIKEVSMEIGIQDYANNICFLQHYPYHCGNEPVKYQGNLKSHGRMQEFYQNYLPLVCQKSDRLVILVRGAELVRRFVSGRNVIDYTKLKKGACSRAHFSVKSDGLVGIRIAEHLKATVHL